LKYHFIYSESVKSLWALYPFRNVEFIKTSMICKNVIIFNSWKVIKIMCFIWCSFIWVGGEGLLCKIVNIYQFTYKRKAGKVGNHIRVFCVLFIPKHLSKYCCWFLQNEELGNNENDITLRAAIHFPKLLRVVYIMVAFLWKGFMGFCTA